MDPNSNGASVSGLTLLQSQLLFVLLYQFVFLPDFQQKYPNLPTGEAMLQTRMTAANRNNIIFLNAI